MSRLSSALPLLALLLSSLSFAHAQDAVAQTGTPADQAAIRAVVDNQSDAWNRGDAEAFATHFAQDGSFTNVLGMQTYGKPAFLKQHALIFSTVYKGSHNTLTIGHIAFLRPDVAVVDMDGVLSGVTRFPPGLKPGPDGALRVKLQEVMTRDNGQWTIAAFHNVAVATLPPGPPNP